MTGYFGRQPFLLGPLGGLQEVECTPTVGRTAERPTSDLITLGGDRYVQQAARAPREWDLSLTPWSEPTIARWIAAAAQGLLGEVWLLDVAAARANMLAPEFTAGRTGTRIAVDGVPLCPLAAGTVAQVLLLPSTSYRVSGVTTAANSAALGSIVTKTAGGGTVATTNLTAPATGGGTARAFTSTITTGSTVAYATLAISSAVVAGLRVAQAVSGTTFADASGWLAGEATPCRVQVVDPERTLQLLRAGHGQADYSVTLREVGRAGTL